MGLRSGCNQTLIGQPPLPLVACTKVMYTRSTSGPFLAVYLHVDEKLVHHGRGRRRSLKRFMRHDVAPVAGRVADGQEDGLVLAAGLGERFLAPWMPLDRVARVLQQVGRLSRRAKRVGGDSGERRWKGGSFMRPGEPNPF